MGSGSSAGTRLRGTRRLAPELEQPKSKRCHPGIETDQRTDPVDGIPERLVDTGNKKQRQHQQDRTERRKTPACLARFFRQERLDDAPAVKTRAWDEIEHQRGYLEQCQECQGGIKNLV